MLYQSLDAEGLANARVTFRSIKKSFSPTVILPYFTEFSIFVNVNVYEKGVSWSIDLKFEELVSEKVYKSFIEKLAKLLLKQLSQLKVKSAKIEGRGEKINLFKNFLFK